MQTLHLVGSAVTFSCPPWPVRHLFGEMQAAKRGLGAEEPFCSTRDEKTFYFTQKKSQSASFVQKEAEERNPGKIKQIKKEQGDKAAAVYLRLKTLAWMLQKKVLFTISAQLKTPPKPVFSDSNWQNRNKPESLQQNGRQDGIYQKDIPAQMIAFLFLSFESSTSTFLKGERSPWWKAFCALRSTPRCKGNLLIATRIFPPPPWCENRPSLTCPFFLCSRSWLHSSFNGRKHFFSQHEKKCLKPSRWSWFSERAANCNGVRSGHWSKSDQKWFGSPDFWAHEECAHC